MRLIMASNPKEYFLDLSPHQRPDMIPLKEIIYSDIQWYNGNRASNRVFHATDGIEGLVVHATAGSSTTGALSWWKQPGGGKASAHWIVPDEDEEQHGKTVLAVVYESLAAWHVRNAAKHPKLGNRDRINHWSLGVEIVNSQSTSDKFSDWQYIATAQIVRYAWAKYPNFQYVFSHAMVDPSRRSDPGTNFEWEKFEEMILSDQNDPASLATSSEFAAAVDLETQFVGTNDGSCCM